MEPGEEITEILDECMKLLDDNLAVLTDIEYSLDYEKEDIVVDKMTKDELIDMVHDVADSSRIKKAEASFVRRFFESTYF
jgi:hypothetical protein